RGADLAHATPRGNGSRKHFCYASTLLNDPYTRYPDLENFAFALIIASRKLRHYFQGREIRVVTDQPLRKILHKPDISGRIVNWAMELSQYQIEYVPRTSIKAQALADFIMECTFPEPDIPADLSDPSAPTTAVVSADNDG